MPRKAKCHYTVEPNRSIYMNGNPYISIGCEGETYPAHADRLTHEIAAWLNRKGCFRYENYPKRIARWEKGR